MKKKRKGTPYVHKEDPERTKRLYINYMDMMEFTGKVAFMEHGK
jgi:hypothetical protein